MTTQARTLHSTVAAGADGDGTLRLTLDAVTLPAPVGDELLVRVEAAPINPSDLGLLLGPADLDTLRTVADAAVPTTEGSVPARRMGAMAARLGEAMPVGNEGAGTVIAAGPDAQALIGRTVALIGGGCYADHRLARAGEAMPLPEGITAEQGAAAFVNPLTALSFVETMRDEGHTALVHTAAASNLGQMLVRLCAAEGVPLVNIVRSPDQAALLRGLGAEHVVDTSAEGWFAALVDAVAATGATLAFDAIGGGELGGRILSAMERAAARQGGAYSRYGSTVLKQLYAYGALDLTPLVLPRDLGFAWAAGGWLLTPRLARMGGARAAALRQRVAGELTGIFASRYTATIGLAAAIDPDTIRAYARRATGQKYLIDPRR